jgi:hypothetical protein
MKFTVSPAAFGKSEPIRSPGRAGHDDACDGMADSWNAD